MKFTVPLFLAVLAFAGSVSAQDLEDGLLAFYPFEQGVLTDFQGDNDATAFSQLDSVCGVRDEAIAFDGQDGMFIATNDVLRILRTFDLSISFYFKPFNSNLGTQTILHRREDCSTEGAFYVNYSPSSNSINVVFSETTTLNTGLAANLSDTRCWHHVTIVRAGTEHRLYLDGELVDERRTTVRINLDNNLGALVVGESGCTGSENNFVGHLDQLRIYDRPLTDAEVGLLYFQPDQIATGNRLADQKDTTVFLGESVPIRLRATCGQTFQWSPANGVDDPEAAEPIITPNQTQVYTVEIYDPLTDCTATDSILITVLDPDDLDCGTLFLPAAFTPNGDQLNDTYGISNPFAVPELISFEIYDRWGGRIFFTDEKTAQWDGSVDGTPVNPGVYLYRVAYVCENEEIMVNGSVTVLR